MQRQHRSLDLAELDGIHHPHQSNSSTSAAARSSAAALAAAGASYHVDDSAGILPLLPLRRRNQLLHLPHQQQQRRLYYAAASPASLPPPPPAAAAAAGAPAAMHAGSSTGGLYAGGRVPPPHPFLRSSSVPEQDNPPYLFELDDGLTDSASSSSYLRSGHRRSRHQPPLLGGHYGGVGSNWPASSSSSSYLRGSSYLRNGGASASALLGGLGPAASASFAPSSSSIHHPHHQPWHSTSHLDRRSNRLLGRQLSVSSELPVPATAAERYRGHPPFLHRDPLTGLPTSQPQHSAADLYHPHGSAASDLAAAAPVGSRLRPTSAAAASSLRGPLTLGRSLQLVTSGGGSGGAAAASGGAAAIDGYRRKKTVRFNSEEWGAPTSGGAVPGAPLLHHPAVAAPVHHHPHVHPHHPASAVAVGDGLGADLVMMDEGDLWMGVEDVRSGRWARWDALRQESQESTTRDSGIETGSCFTSSEDSNRGDHIGKKVERKETQGYVEKEGMGQMNHGFVFLIEFESLSTAIRCCLHATCHTQTHQHEKTSLLTRGFLFLHYLYLLAETISIPCHSILYHGSPARTGPACSGT